MLLEFPSLVQYGVDRAAEVMGRGFEDYLVKIASSPALLLHMARSDSVDLVASRVIVRDGVGVGGALIARRGWTSRLAGMSIVAAARGQGVGRATMAQLLAEAKARGDRAMVLEVIEQNEPAVKLYERCGFQRVRRLAGFSHHAPETPAPDTSLEEVDLRELATVVARHGLADLPWQLSSETLAQATPPTIAYRLGGAWAAVANLVTPQPAVRALVTEREHRRRGAATALLRAIVAKHPGKEWRMGALWPEELARVFVAAGFTRTTLSQWQMSRDLA